MGPMIGRMGRMIGIESFCIPSKLKRDSPAVFSVPQMSPWFEKVLLGLTAVQPILATELASYVASPV